MNILELELELEFVSFWNNNRCDLHNIDNTADKIKIEHISIFL